MLKKISSVLLVFCLVAGSKKVAAQADPHFAQYYMYSSWLNPALTGVFDGDYRVAGAHRQQWGNVTSPFTNYGVSVDFHGNRSLNYGASVLQQSAGDGGYNYTTAYGNVAFTGIRFGPTGQQRVVVGLQAGLIQRKFNPSKLSWPDQWSASGSNNPTAEVLTKPTSSNFDAGAGVLYFDGTPGKNANLYAGFSASHINQPDDKFSGTGTDKFPIRYTLHAGVRLRMSEVISITPNALYLRQGNAEEKMLGLYGQLNAAPETDFLLGINYRFKDAISPYAGFYYKGFTLGASYDINNSDLSKLAGSSNSFEITLSFIGKKRTKTPETEFICPRL